MPPAEHLPAGICQLRLDHADLPAGLAAADGHAHGARDDLVAEADAYDADAAGVGERAPDEVDQGEDPGVVLEGRVLGARDEDGVGRVEGRVGWCEALWCGFFKRVGVGYDIVSGERRDCGELFAFRCCGAFEEGLEDAVVAFVSRVYAREGDVGFEDGEAEGGHLLCGVPDGIQTVSFFRLLLYDGSWGRMIYVLGINFETGLLREVVRRCSVSCR
ncbi:hypothetical protein QBC47DRAFT_68895 [Echria macrotheca]|uniref:Uncharacterized protein n=1 Tax=Echria macrotheca TaxID=438768 RepID=A0AAJ0BAA8_9PEZI|nr:hypothetical protein QBC47DRAFT_68895 [Echria macrotheca]